MGTFDPNLEIVLKKNEAYHPDAYPSSGEAGDGAAGYLHDAAKPLPFLDRIVFKLERESIPRWNKFLQGYYDSSGIASDSFDQAVTFSPEGTIDLTERFKDRNILLLSSIMPTTYYFAFNMDDPLVGGYAPHKQKLRQHIHRHRHGGADELFANGRGVPAHGPIPPGIFGYEENSSSFNPTSTA